MTQYITIVQAYIFTRNLASHFAGNAPLFWSYMHTSTLNAKISRDQSVPHLVEPLMSADCLKTMSPV